MKRVADVVALEVIDGYLEDGSHFDALCEDGPRGGHLYPDRAAEEGQTAILLESSGEQMGLGEDLETIANADDWTSAGSEALHRGHYGGETCDRSGAEVITVSESSGNDDGVGGSRPMNFRAR